MTLIPNEHWDYGLSDMLRGLATAVSSGEPADISIPNVGVCIPVRSARAGIVAALRALDLGSGASVGVPLYCCPVLFRAVRTAGYRTRFIDVDEDTYCLSPGDLARKSSEVDAIIAVHMFGNMCDVPALRDAAPGKPVIEDCAQAIGSRLGNKSAGLFGDIAAFSFRSGKYVSVGEGGALRCSNADLWLRLSRMVRDLPTASAANELVHVVKTQMRSMLRRRPWWGLIGNALWNAYTSNVSYESQAGVALGQMFRADRELAVRRLDALEGLIENQRRNAAYFDRTLKVAPTMLCCEKPGTFYNRLQYPVLASSQSECEQLVAQLRRQGVSTSRPYKDIAEIATQTYGYSGDCPHSERIAKSVFVIPCNYALTMRDVERISTALNIAWTEIRSDRQTQAEATLSKPSKVPEQEFKTVAGPTQSL